mgnify:CR=1 FL=1
MKGSKVYFGTVLIVVSFLLVYFFITDVAKLLDPVIFPPLLKILSTFVESLPDLFLSVFSSLRLLIPSYFGAAFAGISLGLIIGLNPRLTKTFRPIIFALNPIPPSMLTPYMIAIMPTFYFASVGIIFIACFWPFLNGTLNGIYVIDQKYLDNAKILDLTGLKRIRYVILPAAAPSILSGAGSALNLSFIMLAVAEMFAVDSGIGHFIQYYADFSDYARVISGIIFLGIFTVTVMMIFQQIKKRILFWTLNENK